MKSLLAVLLSLPLLSYGWGSLDENEDGTYTSAGGATYEYDLNRPSDQLRYEVDPAAQLRDEVAPPNPSRELMEEVRGQSGGGYYND